RGRISQRGIERLGGRDTSGEQEPSGADVFHVEDRGHVRDLELRRVLLVLLRVPATGLRVVLNVHLEAAFAGGRVCHECHFLFPLHSSLSLVWPSGAFSHGGLNWSGCSRGLRERAFTPNLLRDAPRGLIAPIKGAQIRREAAG